MLVIEMSTTKEESELMGMELARRNLKDLEGKEFIIQEIAVMVPENPSTEERSQVVIKTDGQYYKGVATKVIETAAVLCGWSAQGRDSWREKTFAINKTSGKYGNLILEMI